MDIITAINLIESHIKDPKIGLPQEVFFFLTRLTPMVNIDLLIKDENNRVLLAWRDDEFAGKGWHIPGGIVRYKEKFETRVNKVIESEIGIDFEYDPNPIAINQVIVDQETRGHFVSILYNCFLSQSFQPANAKLKPTDSGYLAWHETCPKNLIEVHKIYKKYFN